MSSVLQVWVFSLHTSAWTSGFPQPSFMVHFTYGTRAKTVTHWPISPSKRLMLLFWVFVGEALVWSFVAVKKPTKPLGTAKELWTMWTTLTLLTAIWEDLETHAAYQQYPKVLQGLTCSWGHSREPGGGSGAAMQDFTASLEVKAEPAYWWVLKLIPQLMVQPCLSWYFPIPTLSSHFALESWLQIFPLQMPSWGHLPLHPKVLPAAWADLASLLWHSLMRNNEFSTKCLLSQLLPPLEDFCCVRKMWRFDINALLVWCHVL